MKKTSVAYLALMLIVSCGTFSVKTEVNRDAVVEKAQKSGLIVRAPHNVGYLPSDYVRTISHWMAGLSPQKDLLLISDAGDKLSRFESDEDRFYQATEDNRFLKYKSIGVINLYLKDNREELKKIMDANSLDSLFVYEVFGVVANEMQFIDYDTVLMMMDSNLNLVYLDRQNQYLETYELDYDRIKIKFLDSISDRLTRTLIKLGYLEK